MDRYVTSGGLEAAVISRGLAAPVGRPPHPFAKKIAEAKGVPLSPEKRASMITGADIAMAAAVFVMDHGHRREVQRRFPVAAGKTFLLGQWQDLEILDPINEPESVFERVWEQCDNGAKAWVRRLQEAGILRATAAA